MLVQRMRLVLLWDYYCYFVALSRQQQIRIELNQPVLSKLNQLVQGLTHIGLDPLRVAAEDGWQESIHPAEELTFQRTHTKRR